MPDCEPQLHPCPRTDTAAWIVVIPVKGTAGAKSRLNASPALAAAIALDTVQAALAVARVIVVTSPQAAPLFSTLGAAVIRDPGGGLNRAVDAGLAATGDRPVAVLLGDLPALVAPELRAALDQAATCSRAMVPDADGTGTVLITAQDGSRHTPAFGGQSRRAHLTAGYTELDIPSSSGLRRDVDTFLQLNELAAARRLGRHTAAAAKSADVPAPARPRLYAAHPSALLNPIGRQLLSPSQRWSA